MAKISEYIKKLMSVCYTPKGRNILTFLIFLVIATIFWFMMALNDVVQRDYSLPVVIDNIPEEYTFITSPPNTINVVVKSKGRTLLKYDWGSTPRLGINFKDFKVAPGNRLTIDRQKISNAMRGIFGDEAEILLMRPDSISLLYTTHPGIKLPVIIKIDAQASPQYIVSGHFSSAIDSVTVFSVNGLPSNIYAIPTENLSLRNLTDSTTVTVALKAPAGTRVEPSKIKVTIPVQPLVAKTRSIPVTVKNAVKGTSVITFPSNVDISYLLPMNLYNDDAIVPVAAIDISNASSKKTLPITLSGIPEYYRSVTVSPDEVEFVIEHQTEEADHHDKDTKK